MLPSPRTVVRREAGIFALERALQRRGFTAVAGADEAGRGACAGPLVVAAAILPPGRRGEVPGLADSKLLTPAARERVYEEVVARALSYSVVVIPPTEVDRYGLHVCNLAGMRRALAALATPPDYVLTDGFPVDGEGDRVAACIAAASVVAKVTRDRIMVELDQKYPGYGFAEHKGYSTDDHAVALAEHGPCPEHRFSYVNVAAALRRSNELGSGGPGSGGPGSGGPGSDAAPSRRRSREAARPSRVSAAVAVGPGGGGEDAVVRSVGRRRRSTVSVASQAREGRTG
jgi:ribonuclease HII